MGSGLPKTRFAGSEGISGGIGMRPRPRPRPLALAAAITVAILLVSSFLLSRNVQLLLQPGSSSVVGDLGGGNNDPRDDGGTTATAAGAARTTTRMHGTMMEEGMRRRRRRRGDNRTFAASPMSSTSMSSSPACGPHFRLALPDGNWTDAVKFRRLYFYHVRKAGGSNLRMYFRKVAAHHGLEFAVQEYEVAEEPGTHDQATFYVTHLREPVSRSISHFKYEGRWDCRQLINNSSFVPTIENARRIEDWNGTNGFRSAACNRFVNHVPHFRVGECAANCMTQWFAGRCPRWETPLHPELGERPTLWTMPMEEQSRIAMDKMNRYNAIVDMSRLGGDDDPGYVGALERFFGVPGIAQRKFHPFCEPETHYLEGRYPLAVSNDTLENLIRLNEVDIGLYHKMRDCLDDNVGGGYNLFPAWDPSRFERNETQRMNYTRFDEIRQGNPSQPPSSWVARISKNTTN